MRTTCGRWANPELSSSGFHNPVKGRKESPRECQQARQFIADRADKVVRTSLSASDLSSDLKPLCSAIEAAVPHGRSDRGGAGNVGACRHLPEGSRARWHSLESGYNAIIGRHPGIVRTLHQVVRQELN